MSVPSAHGARPAATAAALPPEEPPGTRARSHGLSVGPYAEFSFEEPIANSSWLVFASSLAPAPVRRETAVAVYGGRYPSRICEPDWLGTPSVQNRSFTASGTPPRGEGAALAGHVLGHPREAVQAIRARHPVGRARSR